MALTVIEGRFGKQDTVRPPAKPLAIHLRALADAVDAGLVNGCVASYVMRDEYEFLTAASKIDCLTLATLLRRKVEDKFFK